MARPTKFDALKAERIINLVRAGNYRETAAAAVDVTTRTLRNWLAKGAKGGKANEPYRLFSEALDQAEAQAEVKDNDRITKAAEAGDWRAAAWRRARKNPDRWGDRQRLEHTGKDGGPIETKPSGVVVLPLEDPPADGREPEDT